MKRKIFIVLALTLALLMVVAGCGTTANPQTSPAASSAAAASSSPAASSAASSPAASGEKKKLVFEYVMMSMDNQYCLQQKAGVEMKAKELGITVNIDAPKSSEGAAEQLAFIETALARGVDGVLIMQSSSEGLLTGVNKCQDANVSDDQPRPAL